MDAVESQANGRTVAAFEAFISGRDDVAEPLYLEALRWMRATGYDGMYLPHALGILAFISASGGRDAEAEGYFREAQAAHERQGFAYKLDAGTMLAHFGEFCRRRGRYLEAEEFLLESIKLCEGELGAYDKLLPGACLNSYLDLLKDTGRTQEAAEVEARIVSISASGE